MDGTHTLTQLQEDNASLIAAVEALEAEIVEERRKAMEAERTAAKLERDFATAQAELEKASREIESKEGRIGELEDEANELRGQVERLEEELNTGAVIDCLTDYLVSLGYPSRPNLVNDYNLQKLIDTVLT
ncbi:hypothetical protein [Azorhizobium caulinodans]|nr:hypothetical protein [Azorhizobium caulinodans]